MSEFEEAEQIIEANKLKNNKLKENDAVHIDDEREDTDTTSNSLNQLTYEEWKQVILDNFPKLLFVSETCISLFGQLLIKDVVNPCALVLIDAPSAGKTIVLNLFSKSEAVYSTDSFTPSSFVSQAANVSTEKLKDIDLLPKIKNKIFLIRDLAPIFGQRDDDLLRNMGILTRVLDGEGYETDAGYHGKRGYIGNYLFMMLGGSTPIPPKVFKLMGNLGSRLFFLNLRSKSKSESVLAGQLVGKSWQLKQKLCQKATIGFLKYLNEKYPNRVDWNNESDSINDRKIIARCAILLARLRGAINIWKEDGQSSEFAYQEPVIEKPDRINQIMYNLARGHALITGRSNINQEDLAYVINVALDSAPLSRTRLFRLLIKHNGELTSEIVMEKLNCSRPTALKEMETLRILGLVTLKNKEELYAEVGRPEKIMNLKKKFRWFIEEEGINLRKYVQTLKNTDTASNSFNQLPDKDNDNKLSKNDAVSETKEGSTVHPAEFMSSYSEPDNKEVLDWYTDLAQGRKDEI